MIPAIVVDDIIAAIVAVATAVVIATVYIIHPIPWKQHRRQRNNKLMNFRY